MSRAEFSDEAGSAPGGGTGASGGRGGFSLSTYRRSAPAPMPTRREGGLDWLIELHDDPMYDHPLWHEHRAVACVRVEVRCKYDQMGKHQWEPAGGPADTVYGFMSLLARFMDGFARARRLETFRWFGMPAGFGGAASEKELTTYPNANPLLDHPSDRLASGKRGPYFAGGLRRNRAWADEFFEHLAAELQFRRLPDPIAMMLATEKGVGDDYGGHYGDPDVGWVPEALRDARANDRMHLIDGSRTFKEYMEQARTLDGGPVPRYRDKVPLGIPPGRSPVNDESSECYRGAIRLAWDWSREQAFNVPARRAFARDPQLPTKTVYCGEYQAACDSKWAPVRVRPRTLLHQMDGIFHSDVQCCEWYGGLPFERKDAIFDMEDGWETEKNWLKVQASAARESDTETRRRRLFLEVAKGQASAHARSAPRAPLAPYVTHVYGVREEDMAEYVRHCRDVGARAVCVWMAKPDRAAHDYWARVAGMVAR